MSPTARAGGVAFLTAAATLFLQVLVHRIVSAKLLNNFAFLIISLTMLGFALSGVVLTRWLEAFLARLEDALSGCAALFVLTVLGVSAAFYHADVGPQFPNLTWSGMAGYLLRWVPLALLFAAPFAFCGLILGALLSSPRLPARRIYFFDLLGSAVGAFAVVPAISGWGVERSLMAACLALLAGTVVLARPGRADRDPVRGGGRGPRGGRGRVGRGLRDAVPLGLDARGRPRAGGHRAHGLGPGGAHRGHADTAAGPRPDDVPLPRRQRPRVPGALPADVDPEQLRLHLRRGLRRAARIAGGDRADHLRGRLSGRAPEPALLVIGVGGGFDVLTALRHGASRITGVEINSATVDILTRTYEEYFRGWVSDPRVQLARAEGRHFLATASDPYDVIQLSGVDSYSGTAAAAHVFSENYLYTSEAFDLYLSRLSEGGILNVMRLEWPLPREMLRALTTAVAALRRAGARRPADHVVMVSQNNGIFTAMLVKRAPFTQAELDRLDAWAGSSPLFKITAGPRVNGRGENMYQLFLTRDDPRQEAAFVAAYPVDISPASDDRPFFFHFSFWRHLFRPDPVAPDNFPVMEWSLLLLTGIVGLLAAVGIYLPLRRLAGGGLQAPGAWRYAAFFAGTGVGYMALEIAFLQKFGLFLGHPNYALSVVLAALLLATGVGSLFSVAIVRMLGGQLRFVSYALAAVVPYFTSGCCPCSPVSWPFPSPPAWRSPSCCWLPWGACSGCSSPRRSSG